MITFSSRFLTVLLMAVVSVSLIGSMAGYALGSRGQRASLADALMPPGTPASASPSAAELPPAAVSPETPPAAKAVEAPTPAARSQRVADTPATSGLPLGATAAKGGVAVTMTGAETSVWEQGLEVRLLLNNTSGKELSFLFVPERQLRLEDNRGVHWNMRWAEYEGEVSLPNGEKRQLVRALYHGELGNPGVENLTLILRDTPGLVDASWTFPAPALPERNRPS